MSILGNDRGSDQANRKEQSRKRDNAPGTNNQPFYKLMSNELRQLYELKLLDAPAYVLLIVKTQRAAGWKWTFKVKDFCKEWGISKTAFYRAVSKLKTLGLLHWEAGDTITVWHGTDIAGTESFLPSKNSPADETESILLSENSPASGNSVPAAGISVPAAGISVPAAGQQTVETLVSTETAEASDLNQIYLDPTDNVLADEKKPDEDEEEETSQGVDDSGTLQKTQEPTGILEDPRPDPITQAQQATVQLLDEREVLNDLRRLGIETNDTVRATMRKFKANVPDAIAHIKQRYNNRHERFKNITGAFVKACQEGAKPQMTTRSQVKPPTIEQMCQLEQAKVVGTIRDFYLAPCSSDREIVMVDTGSGVMPWWEYLVN